MILPSVFTTGLVTLFITLALLLSHPSIVTAQTLTFTPRVTTMAFLSFSGKRPDFIDVKEGKLAPCPISPNCVSSQATDAQHRIPALIYSSSPEQAMARLKQIIQSQAGATIITERPDYLYAEYTSKLMGFVDDVEFYFNPDLGLIDVRSASRLGQSDLGVNRKRVESITAEFQDGASGNSADLK